MSPLKALWTIGLVVFAQYQRVTDIGLHSLSDSVLCCVVVTRDKNWQLTNFLFCF